MKFGPESGRLLDRPLSLTAFWIIVSKPLWNNPKICFRGNPDLSQNGSFNEIFGFYT